MISMIGNILSDIVIKLNCELFCITQRYEDTGIRNPEVGRNTKVRFKNSGRRMYSSVEGYYYYYYYYDD
jgi:hypothetical protein